MTKPFFSRLFIVLTLSLGTSLASFANTEVDNLIESELLPHEEAIVDLIDIINLHRTAEENFNPSTSPLCDPQKDQQIAQGIDALEQYGTAFTTKIADKVEQKVASIFTQGGVSADSPLIKDAESFIFKKLFELEMNTNEGIYIGRGRHLTECRQNGRTNNCVVTFAQEIERYRKELSNRCEELNNMREELVSSNISMDLPERYSRTLNSFYAWYSPSYATRIVDHLSALLPNVEDNNYNFYWENQLPWLFDGKGVAPMYLFGISVSTSCNNAFDQKIAKALATSRLTLPLNSEFISVIHGKNPLLITCEHNDKELAITYDKSKNQINIIGELDKSNQYMDSVPTIFELYKVLTKISANQIQDDKVYFQFVKNEPWFFGEALADSLVNRGFVPFDSEEHSRIFERPLEIFVWPYPNLSSHAAAVRF